MKRGTPQLKVVLSAKIEVEDKVKLLLGGAADYMTKPFDIKELLARITVLISSHILDELSRLATHYGIIDKGHMVKELSSKELDAACRKCIRLP